MSQPDSAATPAARPPHARSAAPAVVAPADLRAVPAPAPTAAQTGARPVPLLRPPRGVTRSLGARPRSTQGMLALEWTLPGDVDAVPIAVPGLRIVRRDPATDDTDPIVATIATSRSSLPEPGPWTAQLVQAVLEVLAHERPRHQLARWLAPDVYVDLGRHLAASPPRRGATPAARVRRTVSSTHVFEPADGVVEATAIVVGGPRARAVAMRLEGWDGRWRCTRFAIL